MLDSDISYAPVLHEYVDTDEATKIGPSNTSNGPPSAPSRRSTTTLLSRSNTSQNVRDKDGPKGLSKALSTTPPANVGLDPLSTVRSSSARQCPCYASVCVG